MPSSGSSGNDLHKNKLPFCYFYINICVQFLTFYSRIMYSQQMTGFDSMAKSKESARGYWRIIGAPTIPVVSFLFLTVFLNFSVGSASGGCAGPFCASMTGGGNS